MIRSELGDELRDPALLAELHTLENQIDQLSLFAFDIFEKWREKVYSLRLQEIRAGIVPAGLPNRNRPAQGEG